MAEEYEAKMRKVREEAERIAAKTNIPMWLAKQKALKEIEKR